MKMYVLSDNSDTWTGLRLAGIDGIVVQDRKVAEAKIKELIHSEEFGVVLITEKLRIMCEDYINSVMLAYPKTLFLEIPDRHGFGRSKTSVTDYIKRSIGLSI